MYRQRPYGLLVIIKNYLRNKAVLDNLTIPTTVTKSDTDQIASPEVLQKVTPPKESVTNCNTLPEKKKYIPSFTGKRSKKLHEPFKIINDKHVVLQALQEKTNLSDTQIANALGYNRQYIPQLKKRLDKTSLVSARSKRLAKKAVIETLEMKAVTEKKLDNKGNPVDVENKPSHSNRLAAAAMVLDRSEPIVQRHQSESVNINLDGTLLDYSLFQDR